MQNMIDTTNEIANRYRIQFGQEKSKIMIVGKDNKDDDKFKLGQMPLQKTDHYKYLGVTLQQQGNPKRPSQTSEGEMRSNNTNHTRCSKKQATWRTRNADNTKIA